MSQFDIMLTDHSRIQGEYKPGQKIVIFSHGFDVRRDSDGLFHDIAKSLPEDFGYVLFDFHYYEGVFETLRPLSEQAIVLQQVVAWAKHNLRPLSLHLVAHSMGCTIASFAEEPSFETVTYLAPPLKNGGGFRRFFTTHPGAQHKGSHWEITRRSGKTTRVSDKLFLESESADPVGYMRKYADIQPIQIIYAAQDRFIHEDLYLNLKGTKGLAIKGVEADHNFTGNARGVIIGELNGILSRQNTF